MSLKPFTYPLPETRFFHAGRHVYKFKIRNSIENLTEENEVIRVILGNLDNLHPFSTDHFTIFPYLSKWERVSKMKFKHENVHLVPYPYICTLYLELNSFQRNISCGLGYHRHGFSLSLSLWGGKWWGWGMAAQSLAVLFYPSNLASVPGFAYLRPHGLPSPRPPPSFELGKGEVCSLPGPELKRVSPGSSQLLTLCVLRGVSMPSVDKLGANIKI
uniref:Membrane anchored junction protein n=1 Tax=Serinus canaria TaxID=9135 RepID=A0A8C9N6L7_SERCA